MKNHKISRSLQEVWDWKDECCREVAHLPFREAVRKRIVDAQRRAREMDFVPDTQPERGHPAVAEKTADYGAKSENGTARWERTPR